MHVCLVPEKTQMDKKIESEIAFLARNVSNAKHKEQLQELIKKTNEIQNYTLKVCLSNVYCPQSPLWIQK